MDMVFDYHIIMDLLVNGSPVLFVRSLFSFRAQPVRKIRALRGSVSATLQQNNQSRLLNTLCWRKTF
ncbi:hypothetical protein GLS_c14280 [Gluconobacter oxydans DSM 3504]|uniref:Uncharacterized protein n=1 Tax=Gluconobacter oxydans DSM 3504 TaxID=1288313 RepID=A0A067Z2Q7_GLUOY|nr:hypothetical protein GLS_c14280 [Gluconobacter oxydans DSM 3504]